MLVRITTEHGKRIYKDESDEIRCLKEGSFDTEPVNVMDSVGRYIKFKKSVSTDESLHNIHGIDLTFEIGWCIGATITMLMRRRKDEAIFLFRNKDVESMFVNRMPGILEHQRIRYPIGIGARDVDWFKRRIKCPVYFSILRKLKIIPGLRYGREFQSKVPIEFKYGMLIGIVDATGSVQYQNREKYGRNTKATLTLLTSKNVTHDAIQMVLRGVDVDGRESLTYSHNNNRNRTYIIKGYIRKYYDYFKRIVTKSISSMIGEVVKIGAREIAPGKYPCLVNGSVKMVNILKCEHDRDTRWSKIRRVEYHVGSKF